MGNDKEGPSSKPPGRPSRPPEIIPVQTFIPSHVTAPREVQEPAAYVKARTSQVLNQNPSARTVDAFPRDMAMLVSTFGNERNEETDMAVLASDETKYLLNFLHDAKQKLAAINLNQAARTKMAGISNAIGSEKFGKLVADYSNVEESLQILEKGLNERGFRFIFEQRGAAITYSPAFEEFIRKFLLIGGYDIKADVKAIVDNINSEYIKQGIKPTREQLVKEYTDIMESYAHTETYKETDRQHPPKSIEQKKMLQGFVNSLGRGGSISDDARLFMQIADTSKARLDEPMQYLLLEGLYSTGLRAAGKSLPRKSLRFTVSAVNRALLQGYFAAVQMKLMG